MLLRSVLHVLLMVVEPSGCVPSSLFGTDQLELVEGGALGALASGTAQSVAHLIIFVQVGLHLLLQTAMRSCILELLQVETLQGGC